MNKTKGYFSTLLTQLNIICFFYFTESDFSFKSQILVYKRYPDKIYLDKIQPDKIYRI